MQKTVEELQVIYIDILDNHGFDYIYAKQFDKGRKVKFIITENNEPCDMSNYTVHFRVKNVLGNIYDLVCEHDGKDLLLTLNKNITCIAGSKTPYELLITRGDDYEVRTITGYMRIDESVIQGYEPGQDVPSSICLLDSNGKVPEYELYYATTDRAGIVQLNDSLTSDSTTTAATANSVKQLNTIITNEHKTIISSDEPVLKNGDEWLFFY